MIFVRALDKSIWINSHKKRIAAKTAIVEVYGIY